ncbi:permease prefix domain 1-containing protein [Pseudonocardia alaniniphila]|uniref:Permease prefix domain 1-containing protein n=1 Tax=Pseudonocardia alaniniphila TaxID=75291 RepID=A0ABS9TA18_9PSEU|nr:permease prefix domain 1-containing protein [Pseudonocardia alaniniphila]MCH6165263.1 permease prefix domain 1-containing protein [Pseudonocardia alaniniphila]
MRTRGIAEPAIEAYLHDVDVRLIGSRRTRAAILEELRDGLHTATATRRARGATPDAAVAAALEEFGTAHFVAKAFADELANTHARRVSLSYLLTGPFVGITWLLLLAPPNWWQRGPSALWSSIPALPLTMLGCSAGALVLAGTGRLSRWIHPTPRHMLDMTSLLGLACIVGDLLVLAALPHLAASTSGHPEILTAMAAAASLVRLAYSIATLHRCRRARSAVTT